MNYYVKVKFKSGDIMDFTTKTDVRSEDARGIINGFDCIITEEEHVVFLHHVKKIDIKELPAH